MPTGLQCFVFNSNVRPKKPSLKKKIMPYNIISGKTLSLFRRNYAYTPSRIYLSSLIIIIFDFATISFSFNKTHCLIGKNVGFEIKTHKSNVT